MREKSRRKTEGSVRREETVSVAMMMSYRGLSQINV